MGCEQVKEINLLAKLPSDDFVWFCALHYELYPNGQSFYQQSVTGCAVPKPNDLSENLLQWENPHFTSLDPNHPPVVLNGQDAFTYIAGLQLLTEWGIFLDMKRFCRKILSPDSSDRYYICHQFIGRKR
ncbi:unnamed protein product [Dibothriocephalus latus]|uniref:Uncharacterized protein n=1 Tax=Dibothriocephalus latus TaxID=60516 RepID=A0A3P7KVT1_DIBLA|nr:unnamed protein product [Dibothriocephalus latus]